MQPVPNKGIESIRLIINSIVRKVLERILIRYLDGHSIFHDRQHGFRPKRSIGDHLAYLSYLRGEAICKRGKSLAVGFDIFKAFQRVWQKAIFSKL